VVAIILPEGEIGCIAFAIKNELFNSGLRVAGKVGVDVEVWEQEIEGKHFARVGRENLLRGILERIVQRIGIVLRKSLRKNLCCEKAKDKDRENFIHSYIDTKEIIYKSTLEKIFMTIYRPSW
jgi:hypothetical protein